MRKAFYLPVILFSALALAQPVAAQERGDDQGRGEQRRGSQQGGDEQQGRGAERGENRGQARSAPEPRRQTQRGSEARSAEPRARGESARGVETRRDDDDQRGYAYRARREERQVAPYRPYYYPRPYYAFRRRSPIGFGIWLGYPVPYPYYGYPYPYTAPESGYAYPPPPPDSINVTPGQDYGGISFDIVPDNAAIYVDGQYAGIVGDFTPNTQPLTLLPGTHRIEVDAQGYQPIVFDANVPAGQVLPYQGQPGY